MGMFSKLKNIFNKAEEKKVPETVEEQKQQEEVKIYEKGLTKSRHGFVSRLANLSSKYGKVNEEYFEELEEILIMADIGVNTVMNFIDDLKRRVKQEHIENPEDLKEVIVDLLYM